MWEAPTWGRAGWTDADELRSLADAVLADDLNGCALAKCVDAMLRTEGREPCASTRAAVRLIARSRPTMAPAVVAAALGLIAMKMDRNAGGASAR